MGRCNASLGPKEAQYRRMDRRRLGLNWHYSDLGGITAISKLQNRQLQNAVTEFQVAVIQSSRRPSKLTRCRIYFCFSCANWRESKVRIDSIYSRRLLSRKKQGAKRKHKLKQSVSTVIFFASVRLVVMVLGSPFLVFRGPSYFAFCVFAKER